MGFLGGFFWVGFFGVGFLLPTLAGGRGARGGAGGLRAAAGGRAPVRPLQDHLLHVRAHYCQRPGGSGDRLPAPLQEHGGGSRQPHPQIQVWERGFNIVRYRTGT